MNDTMSVEQVQTEDFADLKAFEQRLTEVVGYLRPYAWRWTVVLIVIAVCTACGAWYWLLDEETSKAPGMVGISACVVTLFCRCRFCLYCNTCSSIDSHHSGNLL